MQDYQVDCIPVTGFRLCCDRIIQVISPLGDSYLSCLYFVFGYMCSARSSKDGPVLILLGFTICIPCICNKDEIYRTVEDTSINVN